MPGDDFFGILADPVQNLLIKGGIQREYLQEVRLRAGSPLFLRYQNREISLNRDGQPCRDWKDAYRIRMEEVRETLEYLSGYSMYAFEDEVKQGYFTIPGGHRVGLAGKVVAEEGRIQCVRQISFLNIRLSHQILGCAEPVLPLLIQEGQVSHTLIVSPPGAGKTTLLRDLIRLISNGVPGLPGRNVGVADERSELGGAYLGVPQNDLGVRTDVLDGCPKGLGMTMLLRSMAPQVIAVDEIGSERDAEALENVFYSGCKILATVHGSSLEEIKKKPLIRRMMEGRVFERYVLLGFSPRAGSVRKILNGQEETIFCGKP